MPRPSLPMVYLHTHSDAQSQLATARWSILVLSSFDELICPPRFWFPIVSLHMQKEEALTCTRSYILTNLIALFTNISTRKKRHADRDSKLRKRNPVRRTSQIHESNTFLNAFPSTKSINHVPKRVPKRNAQRRMLTASDTQRKHRKPKRVIKLS